MRRSQKLKQHLLTAHWRNLVRDNANIDMLELSERLKHITYLNRKTAKSDRKKQSAQQLNLFDSNE